MSVALQTRCLHGPEDGTLRCQAQVRTRARSAATSTASELVTPMTAFNGAGGGLQGQDLNLRPSEYESDELPGCSTLLKEFCYIASGFVQP